MTAPDLYLVKLTAEEALVARLALRAVAPGLTPHERVAAEDLDARLADARPLGGPG